MKILRIILLLIVLLAIIFFGRGLLTPNFSYESEITVEKPIKEAWAVMNDESKLSEWMSDIKSAEHVGGEKGKVGQVTKYTFSQNGQESEIIETVKEIRPNEYIAMDFNMAGAMTMNYSVNFSEKDGKTHIKSATTNTGEGIFMKSMLSFMQGGMKTQEDTNMGKLKKLINENQTDYFPVQEILPVEEMQEE